MKNDNSTPLISKIKKIIGGIFYYSFFILTYKNVILFESAPDLEDNTYYVFQKMIDLGYNKKYKLVWIFSDDNNQLKPYKNVVYVKKNSKFRKTLYMGFSKYYIVCNRMYGKHFKNQKSIFLSHGTPIKSLHGYYKLPSTFDYQIAQSSYFIDLVAEQTNYPKEKVVGLGYPRIDGFFDKKRVDLENLFGKFNKYVIWYPTVRLFENGRKAGNGNDLSILKDKKLSDLNSCLIKQNICLIVKHHFANMKNGSYESLSNIKFINDSFIKQHNFKSYELVKEFDALITDYSSIYYDYLFLDKPICLTWCDLEEYKKQPGLVDDYEFLCSGSYKALDYNDFVHFFEMLSNNNDPYAKQRHLLKEKFGFDKSINYSEALITFLEQKFDLKL